MQAFSTRRQGLAVLALLTILSTIVAAATSPAAVSSRAQRHLRSVGTGPTGPGGTLAAIDSIFVDPSRFSPNGDSLLDEVSFSFRVQAPTQVVVLVTLPGQTTAIDTVLNDILTGTGERNPKGKWDGRDGSGRVVADGTYEFLFQAIDSTGTLSNRRQFVVDTVAPMIDSLTITPSPFTPMVSGASQDLRVSFRVSQSQLDDFVGVDILYGPDGSDTLTVDVLGDFSGDGVYSAICNNCADTIDDGVHTAEAFGLDLAGNQHTAVDSFDANILGPTVELTHPTGGDFFDTQQADSLVGTVTDRQNVAVLSLLVSGALDTTLSVAATPSPDSTLLSFHIDVSQMFAAEGTYELILPAVDADGVSDSTRTMTYTVDRTRPAQPIVAPPLPPVISASAVDVTVLVDSTAEEMFLVGAAIDLAPIAINGQSVLNITQVPLDPGNNTLAFTVVDFAGNLSPTETVSIFRESSEGLSAPERFQAGQSISVDTGTMAQSIQVRIVAMDGALVRVFTDSEAKREYVFSWDLTTPEGIKVRNGPYMVVATVNKSTGVQRYRKMIAVIE